jgi:hypothetical protein
LREEKFPEKKEELTGQSKPTWSKTGRLATISFIFFLVVVFGLFVAGGAFNILGFLKGSFPKESL